MSAMNKAVQAQLFGNILFVAKPKYFLFHNYQPHRTRLLRHKNAQKLLRWTVYWGKDMAPRKGAQSSSYPVAQQYGRDSATQHLL